MSIETAILVDECEGYTEVYASVAKLADFSTALIILLANSEEANAVADAATAEMNRRIKRQENFRLI